MTPEEQADLLFGGGPVDVEAIKKRRLEAASPNQGEGVRGVLGAAVSATADPFNMRATYSAIPEGNEGGILGTLARTIGGGIKGATFGSAGSGMAS